jgi:hypothetical protein
MSARGPFPTKDDEINIYFKNVVPYLNNNKVRLQVSDDNLDPLNLSFPDWLDFYPKTKDSTVRTKFITAEKNGVKKDMKVELRKIFKDIPKSILTLADRMILKIKEAKKNRTKIKVQQRAPNMVLRLMNHCSHKLGFQNPLTPDSKKMPYGNKIHLEIHVDIAGIKAKDVTLFERTMTVTKANQLIAFSELESGKTAYYRSCYENAKGERGKFSAIKSYNIP